LNEQEKRVSDWVGQKEKETANLAGNQDIFCAIIRRNKMATITIEKENLRAVVEAIHKEIELNSHITLNFNFVNVQVGPRPKEPITDPSRLLIEKKESMQDFMARINKDPWLSFREVALELGVCAQIIVKYCRYGLIEGENSNVGGWFIRESELKRLKENKNWLKEFQELAKNKPLPDKSEIFHKRRVEIMSEIEWLHREHEPLNPKYAMKHYKGLYSRARRYFGSWFNAISVTGIHPSQVFIHWDKSYGFKGRKPLSDSQKRSRADELLQRINRLLIENKLDCSKRRKLDYKVWFYFGGWREVYKLLGLKTFDRKDGRHAQIRTRKNIIEEIQELYRSGTPLNYKSMYKTHRALLKAAEKKFRGSWSAAVRAAVPDIDYSKVRLIKERSKESIITEILSLHCKGAPLNNSYMRKNYLALLSSAEKIFGSWSRAIEETGLDYDKIKKPWKGDKLCLGGEGGKRALSLVNCLSS
jgi:hypothetical protein